MEKVYIFGHKKPDTDSVAGAISFAYLKRKLGINAEARILSEVNIGENNPAYGRIKEKHPMYGKHHTLESKKEMSNKLSKPVICLTTGKIFNSSKEASIETKISCSNINECCRNKRQSAGKHPVTGEKLKWEFYKK